MTNGTTPTQEGTADGASEALLASINPGSIDTALTDTTDTAVSEAPVEAKPPSFNDLPLHPDVKLALDDMGYFAPTPVQTAVFHPVSEGKDLLVQSRTGTGKTTAFGLPLINKIIPAVRQPQAMILCPTRELALQVARELTSLGKHRGVLVEAVYGGAPIGKQITALRDGVHIIVGTPGRVLDHIGRRTLDGRTIGTFVLDECDEMLSMGFLEDIERVTSHLPEKHQTLLFSATMPVEVERYAKRHMKGAENLSLSRDSTTVTDIHHAYYIVSGIARSRDLLKILYAENPDSAIIFCNMRDETTMVAKFLKKQGLDAEPLSSDLSQADRERVMNRMKAKNLRFLCATDVAARGIDISNLSHVINFSVPESPEIYVHRTGRTGRAGKKGTALSLVGPRELGNFRFIRLQFGIKPEERVLPKDDIFIGTPAASLPPIGRQQPPDPVQILIRGVPSTAGALETQIFEKLLKTANGKRVLAQLVADKLNALSSRTQTPRPRRERDDSGDGERSFDRERGERDRGDRGGGFDRDRPRSFDRDRGPRGDRDERPRLDRPSSPAIGADVAEVAPQGGANGERGEGRRFDRDRGDRGDRGERRFDRDRPRFGGEDRGPREDRPREDRPREDRPREDRPREDRGERGEGRRFDRDRGDRGERRFDRDRGERGPREDRGPREPREPASSPAATETTAAPVSPEWAPTTPEPAPFAAGEAPVTTESPREPRGERDRGGRGRDRGERRFDRDRDRGERPVARTEPRDEARSGEAPAIEPVPVPVEVASPGLEAAHDASVTLPEVDEVARPALDRGSKSRDKKRSEPTEATREFWETWADNKSSKAETATPAKTATASAEPVADLAEPEESHEGPKGRGRGSRGGRGRGKKDDAKSDVKRDAKPSTPDEDQVETEKATKAEPAPARTKRDTVVSPSPDGSQARLFVSLGKKHGVTADDLRSLLSGPIGGDTARIGSVSLRDSHAHVRVPEELVDAIITGVHGTQHKDHDVTVERSRA